MLQLEDVRLVQGEFTLTADLEVAEGQLIAVIGPSGGGKSTLLAGIGGFLVPQAGRIRWQGRDITDDPPGARPVASLFQDGNLFPHLTITQNVGLGLRPALRLTAPEGARVEAALREVGLQGMGARRPADLSGGQQGRAALARVLVSDRSLVTLDEPFAALGPALKQQMLDLAARSLRAAGRSVLMVTHDPGDARGFADAVIFIDGGVAAAPVPTQAIFADPPPGLRAYLGKG